METVEHNTKTIRKSRVDTNYTSASYNGRKVTLSNDVSGASPRIADNSKSNAEIEGKHLGDHGISIANSSTRNFSNISPEEVARYYQNLGNWQDILPKTDYTYSPVSIYYTKKINGKIPIIPNMSRRNIWNASKAYTDYEINLLRSKNYSYEENFSKVTTGSRADSFGNSKSKGCGSYTASQENLLNKIRCESRSRFSIYETVFHFYKWVKIVCETIYEKATSKFYKITRVADSTNGTQSSNFSQSRSLLTKLLLLAIIASFFYFLPSKFSFINLFCTAFVKTVSSFSYLVFELCNLTQSSVTFIMSLISVFSNYIYDAISALIIAPAYKFVFLVWFSNETAVKREINEFEKLSGFNVENNEFAIHRWFDSNTAKIIKKIIDDDEFTSFINEKFKKIEENQNSNIEKVSAKFEFENTVLAEKFDLLQNEISELRYDNAESIKNRITILKEEIKSEEKQIENNLIVLLSTVIGSENEPTAENVKGKFVSLFEFVHDAHNKIDKLSKMFSNHVRNASETFEYTAERTKKELNYYFKLTIEEIVTKRLEDWRKSVVANSAGANYADGLEKYVKDVVRNALEVYDADKTGQADYALESSGGIILSTRCTETKTANAQFSIFGIPFWHVSKSPRTVIQPGVHPGECWAFPGSTGFLVIQLSERIIVTGFTLEHIPRSLASNGTIDSAPKHFSVWTLRWETDPEPEFLGEFQFDADGTSLQYFEAIRLNESYQIVELKILSNHGKMDYTCLYRFRVHGIPAS